MIKETELAAAVVDWLQQNHWDVYQEVSLGYGVQAHITIPHDGGTRDVFINLNNDDYEIIGQAHIGIDWSYQF